MVVHPYHFPEIQTHNRILVILYNAPRAIQYELEYNSVFLGGCNDMVCIPYSSVLVCTE